MKFTIGNKYQFWYIRTWVFDGIFSGDYRCDACRKPRKSLYWFHAEDNSDDHLKLGSECVKEMHLLKGTK